MIAFFGGKSWLERSMYALYAQIGFKYKKQAKRYLLDTIVSCAFVSAITLPHSCNFGGTEEIGTLKISMTD